jgi:hypothetical protein
LDEGLVPVFPPLEPGGDYWDLSFLQSALRGLQRRGQNRLLDQLALGAYAWAGNRSLEWGAGGPERWRELTPYSTPAGSENQCGFRIFDWYLAIAQHELGKRLPLFLLRAGSVPNDHLDPASGAPDYLVHAEQNLTIARLLANEVVDGYTPVPSEVLAANFWLLAAHEKSAFSGQSWFKSEEEKLPVVNGFYRLAARKDLPAEIAGELAREIETNAEPVSEPISELDSDVVTEQNTAGLESASTDSAVVDVAGIEPLQPEPPETVLPEPPETALPEPPETALPAEPPRTISHYVLLPLYAWGAADWDLEVIQPLLQESHPTVGFSLTEARLAARVTVVGGDGAISAEALDMLRSSGCKVERVMDDGTLIAS